LERWRIFLLLRLSLRILFFLHCAKDTRGMCEGRREAGERGGRWRQRGSRGRERFRAPPRWSEPQPCMGARSGSDQVARTFGRMLKTGAARGAVLHPFIPNFVELYRIEKRPPHPCLACCPVPPYICIMLTAWTESRLFCQTAGHRVCVRWRISRASNMCGVVPQQVRPGRGCWHWHGREGAREAREEREAGYTSIRGVHNIL
jgi:hypothetical protein